MRELLIEIAEYNHFCNQKLIADFTEKDLLPEKSRLLFSHILNAHHIWNSRIIEELPLVMPWDELNQGRFREINEKNHKATLRIIEQYDLNSIVTYSNTKGERFSNSVAEMLFHVFNHSTYHRGQIAMDLRQNGITPASTDYIFYKRETSLADRL